MTFQPSEHRAIRPCCPSGDGSASTAVSRVVTDTAKSAIEGNYARVDVGGWISQHATCGGTLSDQAPVSVRACSCDGTGVVPCRAPDCACDGAGHHCDCAPPVDRCTDSALDVEYDCARPRDRFPTPHVEPGVEVYSRPAAGPAFVLGRLVGCGGDEEPVPDGTFYAGSGDWKDLRWTTDVEAATTYPTREAADEAARTLRPRDGIGGWVLRAEPAAEVQ